MTVKFEGVPISLGGTVYIVPPLSTGAMRRMQDEIDSLGQSGSAPEEQIRTTKIAHAAMIRNYPQLTLDELEELVDAGNIKQLLGAVFGQSAVEPVGEAKAPQASASQSTGTDSTQG